ncbi:MAG: ribonuclease J, partial [Lachnospiraceae bacterium]|nr:ribonuclease J [Lachnospiraceae bacterium]
VRESDELLEEAREISRIMMDRCMDSGITDWNKIKNAIRDELSDFFWKKTKRRPMILPIIMEV